MQDGTGSVNTHFEDLLNQAGVHMPTPPTPIRAPEEGMVDSNNYAHPADIYANFIDKINATPDIQQSPKPVSPFMIDTSGRYRYQRIGGDTEQLYAEGQSTWDKMFNGITKGVALASTTFLQGTLGMLYGVDQLVNGHGLHSLYDNDFSNALQDFNNSLENKLPNYYSATERNAEWWQPQRWFTANFLWDKFIKALGFSVGAIYSGAAVSKALQLVPAAFGLSKAGILSNIVDGADASLSSIPSAERSTAFASQILKGAKSANTVNALLSPVDRAVVSTLGAITEGGIEALQGVNDYRNEQIQNYKDKYGYAPSGDDLAKINDFAEQLGNARFGLNIALLSATNYYQLPKLLSSSYKEGKMLSNGIETVTSPIRKGAEGLWESALPKVGVRKLLYKAGNISGLLFAPSEAFEEGAQNAIQVGVDDYYSKAYKGEGRNFINSLGYGWSQTLSSTDGMEQVLLGGLSGGLQQSGIVGSYRTEEGKTKFGFAKSGEIGERGWTGYGGERAKNTEDFVSLLNSNKLTLKSDKWMADMAQSVSRGINLQKEGESFIRQGDVLEYKDNEFDYAHNYLTPRIKYDRIDLVKDDINNYRQLASTEEGWLDLQKRGVVNPGDTRETFLQRLSNLETHADNMNSLYKSINLRYGGLVNEDGERAYPDEVIDKMVYAASKVADYDKRIPELATELNKHGINFDDALILNTLKGGINEAATKRALEQINSLDILSEKKDELKSNLRDLMEIYLRRKMFLQQYDQLKNSPEKFEAPEISNSPSAILGGKEYQINKEYGFTNPLYREGNRLAVNPTASILSTTLGGEYEMKTPFGETTFSKPSDVKYPLSEAPIQNDEKYNNLVEKSVDDVIGKKNLPDLQSKINWVNQQNDKELTDKVEAEINKNTKEYVQQRIKSQEAAEKQAKDEKLQKSLSDQQASNEGPPNISGDDVNPADLDPSLPKAPLVNFLSKEADFHGSAEHYDPTAVKPHQKRRLKFLGNFPSMPQQQQANVRVMAITKNNETHFNLRGLTDWLKNDIKNSLTSPDQKEHYLDEKGELKPEHEPIIKLYAIKTKDGIRPIDSEGKPIEGLEEVINNGVFGVFHSRISGMYEFGNAKGNKNWSGEYTDGEVGAIKKRFDDWRAKILEYTEYSPEYPIASVSRGIILRDEENKPLTDTQLLTDEDILNKEGLITVPTKVGQINVAGNSLNFPLGHPLLTNGANIDFLNNRKFTPKEVEIIYNLLKERVKEAGSDSAKRIEKYLSSILYLRSPREGEETSESQIYHIREGALGARNYHFGKNLVVPFNIHAFEQNKDQIINYLSNYYVRVNANILSNGLKSFESPSIGEDGNITWNTHPSYQWYLLSKESNPSPFLQTRARRSVSADDPTIISRYSTLQGGEFEFQAKAPEASQPLKTKLFGSREEKEAAKGKSNVEDKRADIERRRKTTFNNFTLEKEGKQVYEYYLNPDGSTEEVYGKNEQEVRDKINAKYDTELAALGEQKGGVGNKITSNPAFITFDLGKLAGTEQTKEKDDKISDQIVNHPDQPMWEGGKSFNEESKRVIDGIKELIATNKGNTLLVTHNTVFGLIKQWIEDGKPEELDQEFRKRYITKDSVPGAHYSIAGKEGTIYIVRHGETEDNVKKLYRTNEVHLDSHGIEEAKNLGKEFKDVPFDRVVTSSLTRTEETAKYILEGQQGEDRFREPVVGDVLQSNTGKTYRITKVGEDGVNVTNEQTGDKGFWGNDILYNFLTNKGKYRESSNQDEEAILKAKMEQEKREAQNKKKPGSEFKLAPEITNYTKIDVDKELKYIAEKTPFVANVVSDIIRTPHGLYAWGSYKNMVIKLYNKAVEGTGYHEVFEGVWKVFTTAEQKDKIVNEFRNRPGNFTYFDGENYRSVAHSEATEYEIKEALADEFADSILSKGETKTKSIISRWIDSLVKFIKGIFNGDVGHIDDLFAKIDAGHYKSAPYNTISPSEAEQFSLSDVTYTQQYELVRGVGLQVVGEMLNPANENSISLTEWEESGVENTVDKFFKSAYDRLNQLFTSDIYLDEKLNNSPNLQFAYRKFWENVSTDWDRVKSITTDYLKTLGIVQKSKESDDVVEDKDNSSNRNYIDERKYFANDYKNTASRSIKLLFATLPESLAEAGIITSKRTSASLMQQPVAYSRTFNSLMGQLSDLNTMGEKEEKLKELGEKFPNFKRLYGRLMALSGNSVLNQWKLRTRFFQVFSKQHPVAWIQYNQKDGTSFTQTANLENSRKILIQSWIDEIKSDSLTGTSKLATIASNGTTVLKTSQLPNSISSLENKISFLNSLKIPFTTDMYTSLDEKGKRVFERGVSGLFTQLKKSPYYPLDNARSMQAVGDFEAVADAYLRAGNDFESTYQNLEGERQAQFISTNKVSRDVNDINNSYNKEKLYEAMPQLQQISDSVYLNEILYNQKGERKKLSLEMGYIQGVQDSRGKPLPTDDMSIAPRLAQELNQNFNGRYYILIPADSKTQWLLSMDNYIPFSDVALGANNYLQHSLDTITRYYNTEKADYQEYKDRIGEKEVEKRSTIFKELSNGYKMNDDQFKAALQDFFSRQIAYQRQLLDKFGIVRQNNGNSYYTWKGLDGEFVNKEKLNPKRLSEKDIENILRFRSINFAINNVEIQKLFYGNILEYKDSKRYKLFLSPREVSVTKMPEYNTFLNEHFNTVGNTTLKTPLTGHWKFSDTFPTVTMNDVMVGNETLGEQDKKYFDTNSTDAQAISHITARRERHLKAGDWTDAAETQYQYRMAKDRLMMLEDGYLQQKDDKKDDFYPEKLREHDEKLTERRNPNSYYIYVEKPILSGHILGDNGLYHPIIDKFSIVSYSYSALRDTNMREHYVKMLRQGIGYLIVKSGRKVGASDADNFYDEEGNVNKAPYTAIENVNFSDFGTQSDNSSKKESQTRGTQITKLTIVNTHNAGIPISEELGKLANNNISLLKELTDVGYKQLLKEIGAEDVDGAYRITDREKLLSLVTNELFRRELPDNIRQQLTINKQTGDLSTPFESLPNYQQIKSVIYALLDRYITRPKVSGGPKVQVSGALMEKYGIKRVKINGKDVYVASGLKFYTKEDPYCEILLPCWVGKKLREAGVEWDTDEELYKMFKDSPDSAKLLNGIGFRIPTQDLNSVENFRIAGFMPEEMGDTIVVPEELTTKAGSDFDIDKLNTYLKSIYVDNNKQIRVVPYFGVGEEAKDKLKKWLNDDAAKDFLLNLDVKDVGPNPDDYNNYNEYRLAQEAYEEKRRSSSQRVDYLKSEKSASDLFDVLYKQSVENEYYDNINKILAQPENFDRLITPNTADDLKKIRDMLVDLIPELGIVGEKSIISPEYTLKQRDQILSIMGLVGIPASALTRTAVSQLSNVRIDPSRIESLSKREKLYLGNPSKFNIQLPHNIDREGYTTMSLIKDLENRYITDKISQYLNGTVDTPNDAFLAQLNFNDKTAPVYMLLEGWGTPNSKEHPIVSLFMNQPIVRTYIDRLNVEGKSGLVNYNVMKDVRKTFSSARKFTTLPQEYGTLTSMLTDSIKKYYNGVDLSTEERGHQLLILDEFLKYAVISQNLFRFQQGTNYDVANLNDSASTYFKEYQHQKAINNNIFTDVNTYLDSTFIGSQRDAILGVNNALTDVLKIENPTTKYYLSPILDRIAEKWLSLDGKKKVARKLEESLLNYLIQTKTNINNSISHMMVAPATALVNDLRTLKKNDTNSDSIWGNIILRQLIPVIEGNSPIATKNITLAVKARDVFSKNMYSDAFLQLINNPATTQFARSLIKLSFLQNGVSPSVIAYKDSIPAEFYAKVVNEAVAHLQDEEALKNFVDSGAFYRNNWNDETIVPSVTSDMYQLGGLSLVNKYIDDLKKRGILAKDAKSPALLWVDSWRTESESPFISHLQYAEEADPNDFDRRRLFRRVEDEFNSPVQRMIEDEFGNRTTKTLFVQTNAWGDSFRAIEYYNSPRQSVLQNGYTGTKTELNPNQLANYILTGAVEGTITTEEQQSPSPSPVEVKQPSSTPMKDETMKGRLKFSYPEEINVEGTIFRSKDLLEVANIFKNSVDKEVEDKRNFPDVADAKSLLRDYGMDNKQYEWALKHQDLLVDLAEFLDDKNYNYAVEFDKLAEEILKMNRNTIDTAQGNLFPEEGTENKC